ncbi:hypothetical protein J6590_005720 [Homalodisca vitripennis]|nr:hypothetical protein J6590_005720 [Homalodisca vitripennis]
MRKFDFELEFDYLVKESSRTGTGLGKTTADARWWRRRAASGRYPLAEARAARRDSTTSLTAHESLASLTRYNSGLRHTLILCSLSATDFQRLTKRFPVPLTVHQGTGNNPGVAVRGDLGRDDQVACDKNGKAFSGQTGSIDPPLPPTPTHQSRLKSSCEKSTFSLERGAHKGGCAVKSGKTRSLYNPARPIERESPRLLSYTGMAQRPRCKDTSYPHRPVRVTRYTSIHFTMNETGISAEDEGGKFFWDFSSHAYNVNLELPKTLEVAREMYVASSHTLRTLRGSDLPRTGAPKLTDRYRLVYNVGITRNKLSMDKSLLILVASGQVSCYLDLESYLEILPVTIKFSSPHHTDAQRYVSRIFSRESPGNLACKGTCLQVSIKSVDVRKCEKFSSPCLEDALGQISWKTSWCSKISLHAVSIKHETGLSLQVFRLNKSLQEI